MNSSTGFVCGFYGSRDGYEVPVALHEIGLLEVLLTDFYGTSELFVRKGLLCAVREHEKLPRGKVRGSLMLALAKQVAGRIFSDSERQNLWPDVLLSRRIASEAARRNAHIFTYEPYAVARPAEGFAHGRKQIVFYYHPHVDTEDHLYRVDEAQWSEFYGKHRVSRSPWRRRTADSWRCADLVLCASIFTKQSLMAAGLSEDRCLVVPYGGNLLKSTKGFSMAPEQQAKHGPLRLLFVGRNPLRKGLHHLLMAWNRMRKKSGDTLTIVCADNSYRLRELAQSAKGVRWLDSVSADELVRLYTISDALVVPSLCEGFGHVYLEAMSYGTSVIGTKNSALPDIGTEKEGVFLVEAGDVEELAKLLSEASDNTNLFRRQGEEARHRAMEFTWPRFRRDVAAVALAVGV